MALKRKIAKSDFEKLSEQLQAEYKQSGDDYVLDIDGYEEPAELKRAKDREKELRREAEEKLREAEKQLSELQGDDARKRGDIQTLEKSWQKKLEDAEKLYRGRDEKMVAHIKAMQIDGTAAKLAAEISTVPALMSKAIRERLSVDFEGDSPTLRVLDASGKPSALTIDELKAEFVANPDFSSIIVGSKASGGGASKDGRQNNVGSAPRNAGETPNLAKLKPSELAARLAEKNQSN